MDRKDWNFRVWCSTATGKIRYGPDREAVAQELLLHLQDAYETHIANGLTPEKAEQKALDDMGSAKEIAPQLGAIHSPFWGYVLRACQVLLIVLLVLCVIPLWKYAKNLDLQDTPVGPEFDIYAPASYGGDTGRTLHHLSHPELSFSGDGNTFTVTDTALFTRTLDDGTQTQLYIRMKQTSLLPWQEQEEYFGFGHYKITGWFTAVDSTGNVYPGYWAKTTFGEPCMYSSGAQSGIFTYTHQLWINNFPQDAEWVELRYQRDGRDYSLRIDLTGGGNA